MKNKWAVNNEIIIIIIQLLHITYPTIEKCEFIFAFEARLSLTV